MNNPPTSETVLKLWFYAEGVIETQPRVSNPGTKDSNKDGNSERVAEVRGYNLIGRRHRPHELCQSSQEIRYCSQGGARYRSLTLGWVSLTPSVLRNRNQIVTITQGWR